MLFPSDWNFNVAFAKWGGGVMMLYSLSGLGVGRQNSRPPWGTQFSNPFPLANPRNLANPNASK